MKIFNVFGIILFMIMLCIAFIGIGPIMAATDSLAPSIEQNAQAPMLGNSIGSLCYNTINNMSDNFIYAMMDTRPEGITTRSAISVSFVPALYSAPRLKYHTGKDYLIRT